jgi:acyl-CoA reductase-like NAD-dependent aldehyde dehydrogenase
MSILEMQDPYEGSENYEFMMKLKLQAAEAGLRAVGKAAENMLRKQQMEEMSAILQRIADAELEEILLLAPPEEHAPSKHHVE